MKITNSEKSYIYERDGRKCFYCKKDLKYRQVTLDHYLPKSKSDKEEIYNLVLCCRKCNKLKGNRIPKDYKEMILKPFKKAILDGMIKGQNIDISNKKLKEELLKVNRIEDIGEIFVFQSNTMRFYVDKNKVKKNNLFRMNMEIY